MRQAESAGIIVRGHRVASGACGDPRFPLGSIAAQLPYFRAQVPSFEAYLGGPAHAGTINLGFRGRRVALGRAELVVSQVAWTDCFPPENFFLSRAELEANGRVHRVFLYVPDPATKPDHPAAPDGVELLAQFIPDLAYGDSVILRWPANRFRLLPA